MQVITSSTLTVLHDGQFCVGICEHAESGRYGACRVVFGATEPTDPEILAFVCARWATLPFDYADDHAAEALRSAAAALAHANPKRRQREARKQVEGMGIGTKAQQAMSAGYEARKDERKAATRQAKQEESERRFALKQQKRKQKHRGR
mgnify:FL=1